MVIRNLCITLGLIVLASGLMAGEDKKKCPDTLSVYFKKDRDGKISIDRARKSKREFCHTGMEEKFANYKVTIFPTPNSPYSHDILIPDGVRNETYDDKENLQVKSLEKNDEPVYRMVKFPIGESFTGLLKLEIKELSSDKVVFKGDINVGEKK